MFFTVEFKLFVHVPDFCSFCGIMAIFFQCLSIYWMVYPVVVLYSLCGYSLVKYWYITPCNHPQYPETRWWVVDISCKPGYSCMWGIHINLWFALVTTTDFTFPESFFFLNFRFSQIFNGWYFPYGNTRLEPLIPKWKRNCFNHKEVSGQNVYVSLKELKGTELKLTFTWYRYVLHLILMCLVDISELQEK